MDASEMKGSWNKRKVELKLKFGPLTDINLMIGEDKKEELLGKLQTKLGMTKDEVLKVLKSI